MIIQKANFEDLLASYYHGTTAHVAAEHLSGLIQGNEHMQLATLLRDYRERAITDQKEIELRAATDRLMNCCSVMEIASLMDFVLELQQTDFGIAMRPILEDEDVRRYYEDFYPTKMPQLFRCRLAGTNKVIEKGSNRNIMEFLDLDRRFMEKLDDSYFLRMLDSFYFNGYGFRDVVKLISKPEVFISHLLSAPNKRDVRSKALNEFSLFMRFCFDMHQLLAKTESQPLLQSAMWNHYSYWFDIIGDKLNEQLGEALSQFLKWKPEADDKDAIEAVQTYVLEARTVLKVLTSRRFAEPIDALLKKVSG